MESSRLYPAPQRGKPMAERFSGGIVTEVAPELHC